MPTIFVATRDGVATFDHDGGALDVEHAAGTRELVARHVATEADLAEAERGEDVAKEQYEKALQAGLTGSAATVVQAQAAKVRQAHDEVKRLRDREKVTK